MKTIASHSRAALWLTTIMLVVTASAAIAKDDEHGYLGVMLQNVSGSMAKALQLDEGEGVLINEVVDDSPAEAAGLEDGDVILSFDGKAIDDYGDLTKAVRKTAPGDKVEIEVLHDGKRQTRKVEMGEGQGNVYSYRVETDSDDPQVEFFGEGEGDGHGNVWIDDDGDGEREVIVMSGGHKGLKWIGDDGDLAEMHLEQFFGNDDRGFMGVELDDLNEQLGEYFGVDDGDGALISKVSDDSPAAEAGLRAGDVIVAIGDEEVEDAGDVHEVMAETEAGQEVEVAVVRKGKKKTMKITLGEAPDGMFGPMKMRHFDNDFQVAVPRAPRVPHRIREIHRFNEDGEDLDEVRDELDQLRAELKELKRELKQEMKK